MSEEQVGEIVYQVQMDVAQMLQASQQADKAIAGIGDSLDTSVTQFKRMDTQVSATAKAVNNATRSMGNMRGVFGQLGYQIQDVSVQLQMGQNAMMVFAQQGSQIASIFGPSGAVVGAIIAVAGALLGSLMPSLVDSTSQIDKTKNAIETLGKVIQFSQSGVTALSNEYAQLAKTNAALAKQMQKVAIQKYQLAVKDATKAVTEIVSEQTSWWRSMNSGAASVKMMGMSLDALDITTNDVNEAFRQATMAGQGFQYQAGTIANTVGMLASQFDISDQQAFELGKQLNELAKNPTPEALTETINLLQTFKSSSDDGAKAINDFSVKLVEAGASMDDAKRIADQLSGSIENLSTVAQQTNFEQMKMQLQTEIIALRDGELAAKKYALAHADIAEDKKGEIASLMDEEQQLKDNRKAQNEVAQAAKKSASADAAVDKQIQQMWQTAEKTEMAMQGLNRELYINEAVSKLSASATQQQKDEMAAAADAAFSAAQKQKDLNAAIAANPVLKENKAYQDSSEQLKRQLQGGLIDQAQFNEQSEQQAAQHIANMIKIRSSQKMGINPIQELAGSVDPVQQLANENAKKLALIQTYEQKGVLAHDQAVALKNAADTQYEQQRLAALEQQYRAQSALSDFTMDMIDSVGQRTTNAITGIITGTQSATDALRNMAATILDQAVGALVQMGVQAMKNMLIGQSASAASVAQAAITGPAIAAAYSPAAAMVSLASFGANAAAAQAGIASTMGLTKMLSVAGARYNGGPVSANSMYRVGENGKPEIFQASNGSQYMIPGDNGRVVSNRDMQSGGGSTPVNIVINNTAAGTTVENQGYDPDTKTITLAVREVARQLRSQTGIVSRALTDSWNTTGKAQ